MPYMTRNASQPGVGSYTNPLGPNQFYEQRYTTVGPQEWIYAPDAGPWYVTLYFTAGPGSAFIEGTDEGPSDITGTAPNSSVAALPVWKVDHRYNWTDTVTDTTRVEIRGSTAVRVNVVGGTVDVTARA
jgi:hypothetical protein